MTNTEKLTLQITLMNMCKSYFTYKCETRCDISEVTLLLSIEDYKILLTNTKILFDKCDGILTKKR
jgi:hypothetical protein